jgi:hypothetical protein
VYAYEPPRGRRRGGGLRWAAVLIVTCAVGLLVVSVIRGGQPAASARSAAAGFLVAPPVALTVAGCVDQTGSSVSSFAPQVLDAVADAIQAWPGSNTAAQQAHPRPGLHLVLRLVSTHSSATDDQVSIDEQIPGVPGLAPPPGFDDPEFAQNRRQWDDAHATWSRAADIARARATEVATKIRGLRLDRGTTSAISGCLAAAAASAPSDNRRLLLASDLQETEPETVGDYGSSPLLLVVSCPARAEDQCPGRISTWTTRLNAQAAGPITPVRADAATTTIQKWVTP